jgi:hypothetical protein
MNKKELEEQLMKMPEVEEELQDKLLEMPELEQEDLIDTEYQRGWNDAKEQQENEYPREEIDKAYEEEEDELIHKRMNDINTFQAHENEVYLRGTDEYGKDFQICFDSYNFLEWIDTEHLKYIKKQLIKYIKTK